MVVHYADLLARLGHSGLHTIPETRDQLFPVGGEHPAFFEKKKKIKKPFSCQILRPMNISFQVR